VLPSVAGIGVGVGAGVARAFVDADATASAITRSARCSAVMNIAAPASAVGASVLPSVLGCASVVLPLLERASMCDITSRTSVTPSIDCKQTYSDGDMNNQRQHFKKVGHVVDTTKTSHLHRRQQQQAILSRTRSHLL
jgi:hypothetical protein